MRGADTARIGGCEARISAFGQLFYREKEQSEKFCLYLQPRKDDKRRSRRGRKAGLPRFAAILERCRSGRSGRTRNAVYGQLYRGFESLSLRDKAIVKEVNPCKLNICRDFFLSHRYKIMHFNTSFSWLIRCT